MLEFNNCLKLSGPCARLMHLSVDATGDVILIALTNTDGFPANTLFMVSLLKPVVYLAPSDQHLLIDNKEILLVTWIFWTL